VPFWFKTNWWDYGAGWEAGDRIFEENDKMLKRMGD
jgi:hypothetical protein